MFLEKIIGGIVLGAISALTYIAYKHPKGYRKIEPFVSLSIASIYILYGIYHTAYYLGFSEGRAGKLAEPNLPIDPFPWLLIIYFIIYLYLILLKKLPNILEIKEDDKSE